MKIITIQNWLVLFFLLILCICVTIVSFTYGNEPAQKVPPDKLTHNSVIYFNNDTVVHGVSKFDKIVLNTKYGKLEIPTKEIFVLQTGYHCESKLYEELNVAIAGLSLNNFRDRDKYHRFIIDNAEYSWCLINKYNGKDIEAVKRIENLKSVIRENNDVKRFRADDFDTITTTDGSIYKGQLVNREFAFETRNIGIVTAKPHLFEKITFALSLMKTVTLNPSEFKNDGWINTDIVVMDKFIIKVSGEVDWWNQNPGQSVSGPNGLDNNFHNGYRGGAVLLKVGDGEIIVIGESYIGVVNRPSRLYFKINLPNWDVNQAKGSYKVSVQ